MNEAYLCLGGNLGNCLITFKEACGYIEQKVGKINLYSSVYQSQAWGMGNAPDFYNQVIKLETKLKPEELMLVLLDIEKLLGRERKESGVDYQNRIIDIDILLYNDEVLKTSTLEIPHPRLHLRKFVLEPLQEIAPNYIHPVLNKSVSELLASCIDKGRVKKLEHAYKFICIEGNIGVGKTTLVKKLATHLQAASFFEEFDENPWLPLFYQNPKDTALALELSFLTDRCKQLIQTQKESNPKTIVSDYCLDKCLLFAQANLTKTDFETYKKLYDRISATINKPDLVIVLHTSVEALESNIKARGRVYEQTIQTAYLEKLNKTYVHFFSEEKDYVVLNIHCETIDAKNYESIFNEIVSFLKINHPDKNTTIKI